MGYEIMALGSFLAYISDIASDILKIIVLIFYGAYAFIALPFKYFFLPCWFKPLDNDIILIIGHPTSLTSALCKKICTLAETVVVWTDDPASEDENASSLPKNVVIMHDVRLGDRESIEEASAKLENEVGAPTIVINAIDIVNPGKLLCQSNTQTEQTIAANLTTNFWIAQKFLPKMLALNKGHFVMISAFPKISWGLSDCVPYIGSRCGVIGFVESLEDSIKHHMSATNIKFTTVNPFLSRMRGISTGGTQPNFSIRLPQITDSELAEYIITGFRGNKRNIYVPWSFGILLWMENFVPLQFVKRLLTYLTSDDL